MVVEAAPETVDDEEEKEQVTKVWGKLISQVIGEMKNGLLVESRHGSKQSIESQRGRAKTWDCVSERVGLLSDKERTWSTETARRRSKTWNCLTVKKKLLPGKRTNFRFPYRSSEPVDVIVVSDPCSGIYL